MTLDLKSAPPLLLTAQKGSALLVQRIALERLCPFNYEVLAVAIEIERKFKLKSPQYWTG